MRGPEKKKVYRRMIADTIKKGYVPNGQGGWLNHNSSNTIHNMVVLGARHNR